MNKFILFIIILVAGFSLAQYEKSQTVIEFSGLKKYTITYVKKPLYVMVNLKDEQNEEYKDLYVTKFCNHWQEIPINKIVELPTVIKVKREKRWTEIDASNLCPQDKK